MQQLETISQIGNDEIQPIENEIHAFLASLRQVKFMFVAAELFSKFFLRKTVRPWVYAGIFKNVGINQMVSDLVARIV